MEVLSPTLLSWASQLDDGAREQALTSATMPFIYPHIALMPDAHLGLGATVGSVIPTRGAIIPAAVGVDIGCGMIATKTGWSLSDLPPADLPETDPRSRRALRQAIEREVPASMGGVNKKVTREHTQRRVDRLEAYAAEIGFIPDDVAHNWRLQLGSLGSGNHFIEVCLDENDHVWLFLHSGSRGIGNKIAQHHIKVAARLCSEAKVELPHRDLAYLTEGTPEFDEYIGHMRWAQMFALLNREEMMERVVACARVWMGEDALCVETINTHHNYTERETHAGEDVWVSRKGAISAYPDEPGLIPGSMGTASYVVRGLGNTDALCSSPHGAGRTYSRRKAVALFSQDDLRHAMQGIEYRDDAALIDEIPAAYKNIDVVMADAADLVEIRHTLRQIINVKGN